ncbi:MAG: hypothetical protein ACRDNF_24980 [Streptosporangiaceae bacterium]
MRSADHLGHHALFYHDQREYVARVSDFVHIGLASGEPPFIAVPGGLVPPSGCT